MADQNQQPDSNLDELRRRVGELSTEKSNKVNIDKPIAKVEKKSPLQHVRTYKDDIAKAIKKQKASKASIISAEVKKKNTLAQFKTPSDQARPYINYAIKITAGVMIIIGIALILYFTLIYNKSSDSLPAEILPSFIFSEGQKKIDLSGADKRTALRILNDEKEFISVSLGEISLFHLTEGLSLLSAQKFLTKIDARVSGAFLRSLKNDMNLGVHVFDGNQAFLIFKTDFYENSFAGMLQWEKYMNEDLTPLFGPIVKLEKGTTTESVIGSVLFTDKVFKNKDVRMLEDKGEIVLMYSFIDQETILITTNESTFTEILKRITSSRI